MSNIKKVIKIDFLTATTNIEKITFLIVFVIALAKYFTSNLLVFIGIIIAITVVTLLISILVSIKIYKETE